MDKKNIKTVELVILGVLAILYSIVIVSLFGVGLFYEGVLFCSIPIILILLIKFKIDFIKETALVVLGSLIVTYFVLLFSFLKTYHIVESIVLIFIFIVIMFCIKSKKKVMEVLLDSLYSFFRFLLVVLIFVCLVAIVLGVVVLISLNDCSGIQLAYINFMYN